MQLFPNVQCYKHQSISLDGKERCSNGVRNRVIFTCVWVRQRFSPGNEDRIFLTIPELALDKLVPNRRLAVNRGMYYCCETKANGGNIAGKTN